MALLAALYLHSAAAAAAAAVQELNALDKVVATNTVAMNIINAASKSGQLHTRIVAYELKHHPYFPTLVIKNK